MNDDIYSVIDQQQEKAAGGGTAAAEAGSAERPYSKEEYAAKKKAEREEVYARIDKVTEHISEDPVAFKDYLDVMARFPRYSVANTLLIFEQLPEATRVGDFDSWKRRGESVRQGEKAICILEPGDEYTRDDGTIGVSYNVRKVFDERQTSSRHLEPRHPDMRQLLFALIDKSPVNIKTIDGLPEAQGYAHYSHEGKTISVAKGLDGVQLFKALAVELAQAAIAEHDEHYADSPDRETARLAAYVLAGRYGVDNSGLMPVLAVRTRDETEVSPIVREELSRIRDAAKAISERMDKTLDVERGQDAESKARQGNRGDRDAR
ncbi:MAG: ssDNA-binding domain-containing protein [Coriobacteriales bacterium]|jgi:hypothetical protein|nr:ssDNA-binding domain-containing protein [Coriobacteriales bacterium]